MQYYPRLALLKEGILLDNSMETKNYIRLTGGIVRIHSSKKITSLCIATESGRGKTSFPNVVFYSPDMVKKFKVGDRVTIDAHVQQRIKKHENGARPDYYQDYVGDEISYTQRLLAPFIDDRSISKFDGGVHPDENLALMFGQVYHVFSPSDNLTLISLSIPRKDSHRSDICEVACFHRQSDVAKMLSKDDNVMVAGYVRTGESKEQKQNIVCRDIVKVYGFENIQASETSA